MEKLNSERKKKLGEKAIAGGLSPKHKFRRVSRDIPDSENLHKSTGQDRT